MLKEEEPLRLSILHRKMTILKAQLRQRLTTELVAYARQHWWKKGPGELTLTHEPLDVHGMPVDMSGSGGLSVSGGGLSSSSQKRALDAVAVQVLMRWWEAHSSDPYPSEEEKAVLASAANLTLVQVNNWFSNKRVRSKKRAKRQEEKKMLLSANFTMEPTDNEDHEERLAAATGKQKGKEKEKEKEKQKEKEMEKLTPRSASKKDKVSPEKKP